MIWHELIPTDLSPTDKTKSEIEEKNETAAQCFDD